MLYSGEISYQGLVKRILPYRVKIIFVLALVLAVLGSGRVAFGAGLSCYEDWSIAGRYIKRETLVPVKDIHKLADEKHKGEIIKIELCSKANRFIYQLVIFAPNGKVRRLSVDAKKPVFN